MLIGMLFGLAIYNNITMDVHFPPVLFKKILGFDGLFEDLEHTHPSIYRSLITLLQYDSAWPRQPVFKKQAQGQVFFLKL